MKLSKTEKQSKELRQQQLETYWLEIAKPVNVAKLTEETARKGNQLSTMKNNITEEKAVAIVSKVIERLNNSVKVGNKMDDYDVVECAVTLVNDYWYVKLEQLLHFSKLVRQGRLGTFARFGQPDFFNLLGKYLLRQDESRASEYESNKEAPGERTELNKTNLTIKDWTDVIKAKKK